MSARRLRLPFIRGAAQGDDLLVMNNKSNNDIDNLYGELIQIAAVAVAILEEIEADRWKNL